MQFSNDNVTYGALKAYATTENNFALIAGDGTRPAYAKVFDSLGNNIIFSDSIVVDATPPTISNFQINAGASAINTTAVTLSYGTSDGTGTGIFKVEASNNGTTWVV